MTTPDALVITKPTHTNVKLRKILEDYVLNPSLPLPQKVGERKEIGEEEEEEETTFKIETSSPPSPSHSSSSSSSSSSSTSSSYFIDPRLQRWFDSNHMKQKEKEEREGERDERKEEGEGEVDIGEGLVTHVDFVEYFLRFLRLQFALPSSSSSTSSSSSSSPTTTPTTTPRGNTSSSEALSSSSSTSESFPSFSSSSSTSSVVHASPQRGGTKTSSSSSSSSLLTPPASPSKFSLFQDEFPPLNNKSPSRPSPSPSPSSSSSSTKKTSYVPLLVASPAPSSSSASSSSSSKTNNRNRRRVTPLPVTSPHPPSDPFLNAPITSPSPPSSSSSKVKPTKHFPPPQSSSSSTSFPLLPSHPTKVPPSPSAPSSSSSSSASSVLSEKLLLYTQKVCSGIGPNLSRGSELSRLSHFYCHLLTRRFVSSLASELSFLFHLLSFDPEVQLDGSVLDQDTSSSSSFLPSSSPSRAVQFSSSPSPSLFLLALPTPQTRLVTSGRQCIWFACQTLRSLELPSSSTPSSFSLLSGLGLSFISSLLSNKLLEFTVPDLHQKLKERLEEISKQQELLENSSRLTRFQTVEPLSLAWAEKTESRNDYKQPSDQTIYNNREKCRDAFCGLIREWQDRRKTSSLPSSSSSSSSSSHVYQSRTSPSSTSFYSSSTASSSSSSTSSVSSSSFTPDMAQKVFSFLHTLCLPNYPWFARFFQSQLLRVCFTGEEIDPELQGRISSDKLRKLQQRLNKRTSTSEFLEEQMIFFKNFLETANSHCLLSHLTKSVSFTIWELHKRLSTHLQTQTQRTLSLSDDVLSLQILGNLLGFITCLPTLQSFPETLSTAFSASIREAISLSDHSGVGFDLLPFLSDAIRDRTLIGTIPWVIEYMKQISFDRIQRETKQYRLILVLLDLIYSSIISNPAVSRNRYPLSIELEVLFASFRFRSKLQFPTQADKPTEYFDINYRHLLSSSDLETFDLLSSPSYYSVSVLGSEGVTSFINTSGIDDIPKFFDSNFVLCCSPILVEVINVAEEAHSRFLTRLSSKLTPNASTKKITPMVQQNSWFGGSLSRTPSAPLVSSSSSLSSASSSFPRTQQQLRKWFNWQYPQLARLGEFLLNTISSNACSISVEEHSGVLDKMMSDEIVMKILNFSSGTNAVESASSSVSPVVGSRQERELNKLFLVVKEEYSKLALETARRYCTEKISETMKLLAPILTDPRALEVAVALLVEQANEMMGVLVVEHVSSRTRKALDEQISKGKKRIRKPGGNRQETDTSSPTSPFDSSASSSLRLSKEDTIRLGAWRFHYFAKSHLSNYTTKLRSSGLGSKFGELVPHLNDLLWDEEDSSMPSPSHASSSVPSFFKPTMEDIISRFLRIVRGTLDNLKSNTEKTQEETDGLPMLPELFELSLEGFFFILQQVSEILPTFYLHLLFSSLTKATYSSPSPSSSLSSSSYLSLVGRRVGSVFSETLIALLQLWQELDSLDSVAGAREMLVFSLLKKEKLTSLSDTKSTLQRYRLQQSLRGFIIFALHSGFFLLPELLSALLQLHQELIKEKGASLFFYYELICDIVTDCHILGSSTFGLARIYAVLTSSPSSASSISLEDHPPWIEYCKRRLSFLLSD